ncbi:MAG: DsbA family protein, partial [bacterium]|nr:DsbA family protein [bacterium]
RGYVQNAWREVSTVTGVSFNWAFWETCAPRRSTYPACRAVLAAAAQRADAGPEMFAAIQRAYYQEARNPSDAEMLVALAGEIGLDAERFERDLHADETEAQLQEGFNVRRSLGVREFPSLVLKRGEEQVWIVRGYADVETALERLRTALEG